MIVKRPARRRRRLRSLGEIDVRKDVALGAVALTLALIAFGVVIAERVEAAWDDLGWWARQLTRPKVSAPALDDLHLILEPDAMAALRRKRDEALALGVLLTGADDLVPARLALGDPRRQQMRARVRLKGDWIDPLVGRRWSFRVKLRGEGRLYGMKTFSLHRPAERNGIHEWIFHRALQREGLVALRYRFARLLINGEDWGVYAVEEHFDHRMLEHNQRRAGPIIRFDEDLMWRQQAGLGAAHPSLEQVVLSDVRPYSQAATLADPAAREAFLRAARLLEGYRDGSLPAAEIFDLPKMARLYALSDLMGAFHGLTWHNLRFHLDPLSGRLEPIGFDAMAGQRLQAILLDRQMGLPRLWYDEDFCRAYLAQLERLAEPAYLEDLFAALGDKLSHAVLALAADGGTPAAESPRAVYAANQEVMRRHLRPVRALRAHLAAATEARLEVEVISLSTLPIEVVGLARRGAPVLAPAQPTVLARYLSGAVRVDPVAFPVAPEARRAWRETDDAVLLYRPPGTSRVLTQRLLRWPAPRSRDLPQDLLRRTSDLDAFPFLRVEHDPEQVWIRPGEWTLRRDLVIPPGTVLRAGPGVRLDLRAGASLLSRSPLELAGRPDEPILIRSTDATGGGLVVLAAGGRSLVEHTHFESLAAPRGDGWAMTGAVTFHRSPVTLRGVSFARNRDSDDALNLVHSDFELTACRFLDTPSDALDVDFGSGTVSDCRFERAGGDGVDVSGSKAKLERLAFADIADKAVSVGEMSLVEFADLTIARAAIGLVSKDDSHLLGRGVALEGCGIGFAAFRKKPEYGTAALTAQAVRAEQVETLYQLEAGSKLVLEGEEMAVNAENLRAALYPEELE